MYLGLQSYLNGTSIQNHLAQAKILRIISHLNFIHETEYSTKAIGREHVPDE